MYVNDDAVDILQKFAEKLMKMGDRFMSIDEQGNEYLDMSLVITNKHKRRVLLRWVGEVIEAVLDDLQESQNNDYNPDFLIEKIRGIRIVGETDFSSISLVKVLAFEVLDLLEDQTDNTDHSFS